MAASAAVLYGGCPLGLEAALRDATYGSKKCSFLSVFPTCITNTSVCFALTPPCVVEEVLCKYMGQIVCSLFVFEVPASRLLSHHSKRPVLRRDESQ